MNNILYITANPKAISESFGLQVGDQFVKTLKTEHPELNIQHLDLFKEEIPFIDATVLGAWDKLRTGEELIQEESRIITRMNEVLEQFKAADAYIFVTPMWNLSFPPLLKAFLDNVIIAGQTLRYTENGPQGLLTGKKALHIQARGGVYSEGPAAALEFTNPYLKAALAFIGITDYSELNVEGIAAFPDQALTILEESKEKAVEMAKQFIPARV
ncbi:FMN-dependent NADH-azoreductase [Paenibacillus larvae]|uniref:FMN-dependent NADH-azoreductase n=1 Tax=Paenibacillus larvae TaxID=1464 RepID=UPI003916E493